jgi:hypothetical protein
MIARRRCTRVCCAALALLMLLAACRPKGGDELSSTQALVGMLRKAGANVEETALLAPSVFEAQAGRVLQVSGGLVYVYEYGTADRAQAMAARIRTEGLGLSGNAPPWQGRVSCWQPGRLLVIYPGTDGGLLLLLTGLLGDPLTALPEGPEEPYPPAVAAAIAVWAQARAIDPASVEVASYAAAEWLNGCLGLPGPGESCAPGAVSGWIVELKSGDQLGSAHTDELGLQVRLASPK